MDPLFEAFHGLIEDLPNAPIPKEIEQEEEKKGEKAAISNNFLQKKENMLFPLPNISKLKPPSTSKQNIILLLYGSFYPIHNNHLRMLEFSKVFIQNHPDYKHKLNILGGFLMPTHLNGLKKKIGKPLLDNEIRMNLCELAVFDSDWITFIPVLSLQKTNIGVIRTKKFLTDYVNDYFKNDKKKTQKIKIVSIIGDDNLEIVEKNLQKRELFIIVQNRPQQTQKNLSEWANSKKISPFKENIIIAIDDQVPYETSSTEIRNILSSNPVSPNNHENLQKYLPLPVYKYIIEKNIVFPTPIPINSLPEKKVIQPPLKLDLDSLMGFVIAQKIDFSELKPLEKTYKLGEGLQGSVMAMKWVDPKTNEEIPVAVKITELNIDKGRKLKAFVRDLRALLYCNHNNIVHCYGAGIQGEKLFIVMERGFGFNTWNFMQEQRKTWEHKSKMPNKWIKYLAELAEGLQNMSDSGVLHRDLQMNNLVIFERNQKNKEKEPYLDYKIEDFQFKICDFGVSAIESDKHLVVRGSTRHYAPEAIEDKNNYVFASDVYSFGNLMYEIVNGRKTFVECSVEQVQVKVRMGERPKFTKGADLRLQEIIEKCWVHDWRKRPTFSEISKYLFNLYEKIEIGEK